MQTQQAPVSVQAFFNQKKANKSDVIGIEGMNSMIFSGDVKCKGRGIRAWEKARFENYDQKMRQNKYYEDQRLIQKIKNQHFVDMAKEAEEARKKKQEDEDIKIQNYMKQLEKIDRIVVEHIDVESESNDAW